MEHDGEFLFEASGHTGTMVALFLPARIASKLAIKGGLPPEEMHITLGYFGKDLTDKQKSKILNVVEEFSKSIRSITATLGGIGRFSASGTSEGKDVAYLSVDSPDITNLRPKLISKLKAAGIEASQAHGFVPHVTLKYINQAASMPLKRLDPVTVKFSKITVAIGGKYTSFKLEGAKLTESVDIPDDHHVKVVRNLRDYHIHSKHGSTVTRSHADVETALQQHLPAGFRVGSSVNLGTASVRSGVPQSDHVDRDALHIVHPHELAMHKVMGNELHPEHLSSIHAAWRDGKQLEPVKIDVTPDNRYHIEDGNHRVHAAATLGRPVVAHFRKVGPNWTPQRGAADISGRILSAVPKSESRYNTTEVRVLKNVLKEMNEALRDFDVSDTPGPAKKPDKSVIANIKAKAQQARSMKPPPIPAKALMRKSAAPGVRLPGVGENLNLKSLIAEARTIIEGAPGKLSEGGGSRATKAARQGAYLKRMAPQSMAAAQSAPNKTAADMAKGDARHTASRNSDPLAQKQSALDNERRSGLKPIGAAKTNFAQHRLKMKRKYGGKLF